MYPTTQNNGMKVIIVGKTGNGKSSLGNTLLNRRAFDASGDFDAVTKECQLEEDINVLSVVDTPGLFDTTETDTNVKKLASNALTILKSLDLDHKPTQAFLFTLNGACRLTDEELSVTDVLRIIFGNEWMQYAIVVVTHIENDLNEVEFENKWTKCKSLKKIVDECGGRICRIDNKLPKAEHVNTILENVKRVSQKGPFPGQYIDCKQKVLQSEDKLENYNGMPTHRIIENIAKDIQMEILQEMKRQTEREKHERAKRERENRERAKREREKLEKEEREREKETQERMRQERKKRKQKNITTIATTTAATGAGLLFFSALAKASAVPLMVAGFGTGVGTAFVIGVSAYAIKKYFT